MSEVAVAEVVSETALVPKTVDMTALVKEQDRPLLALMQQAASLDWRQLTPPQMAVLLMQKPFSVSGGGTTYLTFKQALLFALRAFELGLSPFSDNIWFDPGKGVANVTLSGKRELARLRGIDLGPPSFEELSREWSEVSSTSNTAVDAKKAGFPKDVGVRCSMRVGDPKNGERSSYTAWLSEWFQSRSPVWKEKPQHMLSIRANEKCLTLVLGTGASALPDEKDLE